MNDDDVLSLEQAYQILELPPDADTQQIRAAYRSLARRFHPDVNKDPDADQRMKRLNAAFALLTKRATGVAESPPLWDDVRVEPPNRQPWRASYAQYPPEEQEEEPDQLWGGGRWWHHRVTVPVIAGALLMLLLILAPMLFNALRSGATMLPRHATAPTAAAGSRPRVTARPPAVATPPTPVAFTPGGTFTITVPGVGRLSLRDTLLYRPPADMVIASAPQALVEANWSPIAWSPQGDKVAVVLAPTVAPNAPQIVEVISVASGQVLASYSAQAATWAPDGQHLALVIAQNPDLPAGKTAYHIVVQNLAAPTAPLALDALAIESLPIWTPDSQSLIFSASHQTQLWEYPIAGQPRVLLSEPLGTHIQPLVWLNSRALVCMQIRRHTYTLTVVTIATGQEQPFSAPDTVLPRPVALDGGQHIVYRFAAAANQPSQLLESAPGQSGATPLTAGSSAADFPGLSADGRLLTYTATAGDTGRPSLCILPAQGLASAVPACALPTSGTLYAPIWSPARQQLIDVFAEQGSVTIHLLTVIP